MSNSLRYDATTRDLIEIEIAGAAVCWEPACRIALSILPVAIFENELAHVAFYWAAGQIDRRTFEGVTNPDRLLDAMERAKWPSGWTYSERENFTESLWSPRMYDEESIRSLCESMRDEHLAWREIVRVNQALDRNVVVQQLLRETVPPPPLPSAKSQGVWNTFRK